MNIGGRPYASWPAFVVPAYETTILFASITAVVAMIALNGLPQPYHPIFNVPTFSSASARSLLPVRRSRRSEVRHWRDAQVSARAEARGSERRCRLIFCGGGAFRPAILTAPIALALAGTGCRQDMHDAPRVDAYEATDAFPDGRGNRPAVEGTVARGHLNDDELLYTGKVNGQLADEFPFPVTKAVLDAGRSGSTSTARRATAGPARATA